MSEENLLFNKFYQEYAVKYIIFSLEKYFTSLLSCGEHIMILDRMKGGDFLCIIKQWVQFPLVRWVIMVILDPVLVQSFSHYYFYH